MAELKKKATRESYGEALAELGDKYENLYVFDADLAAATKTGIFKKKFPDRFFDCGIAESNMMGVAAGMAATGKIPFASTFAMFAAGRAFEQVRNSIGYPFHLHTGQVQKKNCLRKNLCLTLLCLNLLCCQIQKMYHRKLWSLCRSLLQKTCRQKSCCCLRLMNRCQRRSLNLRLSLMQHSRCTHL